MKIVLLEPLGISSDKLKEFQKNLKDQGHELVPYDTQPTDTAECIVRVVEADILILVNYPLSLDVINSCPQLKMISIAFTGYDHVDTKTCKEKGITVCNSAGYSTDSVAELTFGLIISVLRKIVMCDEVTRKGGTRQGLIGKELKGKTLGIVGTGTIGLRVGEIGEVFGCKLLGYSRTKRPEAKDLGLEYVDLNALLNQSDIVSIHTPLNHETENLIGEKEFRIMKPSSILIQTSRGRTVNEEALIHALNKGEIAGAGIDVFVTEPPLDPNSDLLKAKNIVVTPHVAFATYEALDKRADIAFTNIYRWLAGKEQNNVI
jgi:phosphoglycerate dehydrogenase-like enzyme